MCVCVCFCVCALNFQSEKAEFEVNIWFSCHRLLEEDYVKNKIKMENNEMIDWNDVWENMRVAGEEIHKLLMDSYVRYGGS